MSTLLQKTFLLLTFPLSDTSLQAIISQSSLLWWDDHFCRINCFLSCLSYFQSSTWGHNEGDFLSAKSVLQIILNVCGNWTMGFHLYIIEWDYISGHEFRISRVQQILIVNLPENFFTQGKTLKEFAVQEE